MLVLETRSIGVAKVSLSENLESAALGPDVVEVQLAAGRSSNVDSASQLQLLGLVRLAILEVGEFFGELADVVGDMELQPAMSVTPLAGKVVASHYTYFMRIRLSLRMKLIDSA